MGFISTGESHGQGPRQAWVAAVFELVNNLFDRVLKGRPSARDIEAIQTPAAGPAERSLAGNRLRGKSVAADAAEARFNQVNAIPARLADDPKSQVFDRTLAKFTSGGK